jgi:hypothetical protein
MPIPINPNSKAAATLSQTLASASNAFNSATGGLSLPAGTDLKALAAKVNMLGGGIGSPLNGLTGAAQKLGAGLAGAAGTLGSGITSAIGNIGGAGGVLGGAAAIAGIGKSIGALGTTIASIGAAGSLGGAFGQLSAAAGQLNNLLSLTRGKNIPSGGELFKTTGSAAQVTAVNSADWRVRIRAPIAQLFPESVGTNGLLQPLVATNGMIWPYLPNITITTKANYKPENPTHNNFAYNFYQNSNVEAIQIAGEFSVQNSTDGLYWIAATMFLRTATKMFYGQGDFAGNPPIICTLSGYGTHVFNDIPVVVTSFSVDLKDDVNYIQVDVNGSPTWVPAMSTISVTLSPMYNRQVMRSFSLQKFAAGGQVGVI